MSKVKIVGFVTAAIFIISAVAAFYAFKPSDNVTVEIVQDGTVIYTFDLSKIENQTLKIDSPDSTSSNTISIFDGQICITEAECPDLICVKSGILRSDGMPIVCLPNRLVIRFRSDEE